MFTENDSSIHRIWGAWIDKSLMTVYINMIKTTSGTGAGGENGRISDRENGEISRWKAKKIEKKSFFFDISLEFCMGMCYIISSVCIDMPGFARR